MRSVGATLVKLIATATSGLVSFTTNVIRPVKVTCEFSPVQEGTGDPSPDNVRPISGWTGVNIEHTGKNLFNRNATPFQSGKYVAVNETTVGRSLRFVEHANYNVYEIQVVAGQTYTFGPIKANDPAYAVTDSNGIVLLKASNQGGQFGTKHTVQMPSESAYLYLSVGISGTYKCDDVLQVEIGTSTESSYEPYQGATLPITFTDPSTGDPMTVYGGTVTINEDGSADLVSIKSAFLVKNAVWSEVDNTPGVYRTIVDKKNGNAAMISDMFKTVSATSTVADMPDHSIKANYRSQFRTYLYASDLSSSSVAEFVNSNGDAMIVFDMNTPDSYHFTNAGQIKSFLGENNIWHNMNGSITAEYYKKQ